MIRNFALLTLAVLLAGCSQYQPRGQGPFGDSTKGPLPPHGPVANSNAPLGIASVAPPAPQFAPDDQLIPPKRSGVVPADGLAPVAFAPDTRALPPFKRRPEPKPDQLPSPFAPNTPKQAEAPKTDAPAAPKDDKNLAALKALFEAARASWKSTETYEGVLTRREISAKGHVNNEVLLFQLRREPLSVFTRTVGGQGKGREMVYNPGKFGDKMHVMLGEGDSKLVKPGFIAPPVSPDDARVTEKARYSIRDAGFGRTVDVLGAAVAKLEAGKLSADALTFDGEVKRPEFAHPLVGVTHKLRPNEDPLMTLGGTRLYFFDMRKDSPAYSMPVLVVATDPVGREQEYYLLEKVKRPANLTDADFDPARLGKR
jgi:hypothetical protein